MYIHGDITRRIRGVVAQGIGVAPIGGGLAPYDQNLSALNPPPSLPYDFWDRVAREAARLIVDRMKP